VLQVGREHQFDKLAELVGKPEWKDDPRFASREGWMPHLESDIRPAVEAWLVGRTKLDAAQTFTEAGIVAGPSNSAADVIADPHVAARHMLVEMPRTDDVAEPILVPGNPVKMSKVAEGPEFRVPWVGEHTAAVLDAELGLDPDELAKLRDAGIIA
jgi:crotonobetainyl-CoA:carnitine CoA-transferase CaiB-like acyl-CoA transferase